MSKMRNLLVFDKDVIELDRYLEAGSNASTHDGPRYRAGSNSSTRTYKPEVDCRRKPYVGLRSRRASCDDALFT